MTNVNKAFQTIIKSCLEGERLKTRNAYCYRSNERHVFRFTEAPIVTIRPTAVKLCLREWEWFMSGSCDVNDLHKSVHHWWKPFANNADNVPNNYSRQFIYACGSDVTKTFNQVEYAVNAIKNHPGSRRNVITTWNSADMAHETTTITNCHGTVIQFFVSGDKLNMLMYQRSSDVVIGLQHNWCQYWAFLTWMAARTGKEVGFFDWIGGDVHVYESHKEVAEKLVAYDKDIELCNLVYTPSDVNKFKADDFSVDKKVDQPIKDKLIMEV